MLRLFILFPFLLYGQIQAQLPVVGEIDGKFGVEGLCNIPFHLSSKQSLLSVPLPDGRILVAGQLNGKSGGIGVIRLEEDGTLDQQFAQEGILVLQKNGEVRDLQLLPDGHLVLVGFEEEKKNLDFVVYRLLPSGYPDTLFGRGGKVSIDFSTRDKGERVLVLEDGALLIGGTTYRDKVADRNFAFVKLDSRGDLDFHFGIRGKRIIDVAKEDQLRGLMQDSKGNIIYAGNGRVDRFQEFAVGRMYANGKPDMSFHFSGHVHFKTGKEHDFCNGMTLLPDDRILLLGHSRPEEGDGFDLLVVGLDEHGFIDDTFGDLGTIKLDVGGLEYASAILRQSDNRILVAGNTNHRPFLVRLLPNGKLDPSFGRGGVATYKLGGQQEDGPRHMSLQQDGKILLTSLINNRPSLLRLHGNPYLAGREKVWDFTWEELEQENKGQSASLEFGQSFQLKAYLQNVAGPDMLPDTLPLSAMKATGPVHSFTSQHARVYLGADFQVSVDWDQEGNEYYYINRMFFQSVPQGGKLNLLIPHELKQKPMPTLTGSQKSPWVQRGLH
jgi:uncharacterized delta-60 repeat protein